MFPVLAKLVAAAAWVLLPAALLAIHEQRASDAQMHADAATVASLDSQQDYLRDALADFAELFYTHSWGYWVMSVPLWAATAVFAVWMPVRHMGRGSGFAEGAAFFVAHGVAGVVNALLLSPPPHRMDVRGPDWLAYLLHMTFRSAYTQVSPRLAWTLVALAWYARMRIVCWRKVHTVVAVASFAYFWFYVFLTNLMHTLPCAASFLLAGFALSVGRRLEALRARRKQAAQGEEVRGLVARGQGAGAVATGCDDRFSIDSDCEDLSLHVDSDPDAGAGSECDSERGSERGGVSLP